MVKIGIIGGSGLENSDIFKVEKVLDEDTPYGKPSSKMFMGKIQETNVVFLARHGSDHTLSPTNVNYRANIHLLKEVGCTHIIATTAVGSLKEEIERGDFVIIDQFIDFTKHRSSTFHDVFEPNKPAHAPMAKPFDENLRNLLIKSCSKLKIPHHEKGTVVTIEGPRFSTIAESKMFIALGADIINMSIATEATLANEANIPFAAIAMSTDYDCWKEDEEPVTWQAVLEIFKKNVDKVKKILIDTVPEIK